MNGPTLKHLNALLDRSEIAHPEVVAGVKWLDCKHPGWAAREAVDPETLSVSSYRRNILCQVYGVPDFVKARTKFRKKTGWESDPRDYGFDVPDRDLPRCSRGEMSAWAESADRLWRAAVVMRREMARTAAQGVQELAS